MLSLAFCQRACARLPLARPVTLWPAVAHYGTSAKSNRGSGNTLKRSRRLSPHVAAKVVGSKSGASNKGRSKDDTGSRRDRGDSQRHRSDSKPSGGGPRRRSVDPNANPTNDPAYMVGPPNSGKFASLKIVKKGERTQNQGVLTKIDDFEALKIEHGVRAGMLEGVLGHLEYAKPTAVQVLAIKAIMARKRAPDQFRSYLVAAETGSGKTLAYLAPLMSKLKEEEMSRPDWERIGELPVVRSVVLVPTLELVTQVIATVKKVSHTAKLSSVAFTADLSPRAVREALKKRIDVLVCTPEKFLQVFKDPNALKGHLKYCRFLVVDEADTLMDETFVEHTQKVIEGIPSIADLVFCSATIPRRFDRIMRKLYPDAERIVAPNIHKIPRHIDFRVIEVFNPPYLNSKPLALQQALYAIHHDNTEPGRVKRTVVFVNSKDSLAPLTDMLIEKGYDAVSVSGGMSLDERREVVASFVDPIPLAPEVAGQGGGSGGEVSSKVKVLVTTDLLARGIDMDNVRNVILYDLPYSSVDLLHRAGRTGRMGKRGRVFLFVDKKESRSWVKGLEKVVRRGMALA